MAQYGGIYKEWNIPEWEPGDDFREHFDRESKALAALEDRSDSLPDGQVVGALLRFQVADGYAYYVVTKARPLTLCSVPFADNYAIPEAHLRGINKADVLAQMERNRRLKALFSSK